MAKNTRSVVLRAREPAVHKPICRPVGKELDETPVRYVRLFMHAGSGRLAVKILQLLPPTLLAILARTRAEPRAAVAHRTPAGRVYPADCIYPVFNAFRPAIARPRGLPAVCPVPQSHVRAACQQSAPSVRARSPRSPPVSTRPPPARPHSSSDTRLSMNISSKAPSSTADSRPR